MSVNAPRMYPNPTPESTVAVLKEGNFVPSGYCMIPTHHFLECMEAKSTAEKVKEMGEKLQEANRSLTDIISGKVVVKKVYTDDPERSQEHIVARILVDYLNDKPDGMKTLCDPTFLGRLQQNSNRDDKGCFALTFSQLSLFEQIATENLELQSKLTAATLHVASRDKKVQDLMEEAKNFRKTAAAEIARLRGEISVVENEKKDLAKKNDELTRSSKQAQSDLKRTAQQEIERLRRQIEELEHPKERALLEEHTQGPFGAVIIPRKSQPSKGR